MKRFISLFLLTVVCFLLQTTLFEQLKLGNIMPNLLVIITAASGFMYGRGKGLFTGFLCGVFLDLIYGDIIGMYIFIYVLIGYVNGIGNKIYHRDDFSVPLLAIAGSDVVYGLLYYVFNFLLRGRFEIGSYLVQIILPEMVYTVIIGAVIYCFMRWLERKMYPEKEVPIKEGEQTEL